MPIILSNENENIQVQQNVAAHKSFVSPTYFSKSLTGSGKKRGLLNEAFIPHKNPSNTVTPPIVSGIRHASVSTGTAAHEFIPMSLFIQDTLVFDECPAGAECISNDSIPEDERYYLLVTMDYMVISTPVDKREKSVYCSYDIGIIHKDASTNKYVMNISTNLCIDVNGIAGNSQNIDKDILNDYVGGLTVYDIVIATADLWNEGIPFIVRTMLETGTSDDMMRDFCELLNNYSVNLTDYREIYDDIMRIRPDLINQVTSVNLNLLLNEKLKALEQAKSGINTFLPTPWTNTTIKFSPEQIKAITTTDPCCIVQAGAGTGKSTVINNRIKYLKQCGVNLSNVTVLSFTNAAANHIKDIAPEVKSQTIAAMIHDIYSMNYSHNLSTSETMLNVIYANRELMQNDTACKLVNALKLLKKDTNGGLIALSNIAGENFDGLIEILDKINQTTLEIESIICYHAKNLQEPNTVCEHMIMDEVQDNSIFEFIYIISYVIRHNSSLYLVGDCSQTLYEFRASNPKALNCLEMSGVFSCMQLQTNYRSNQNVLDFANLTLLDIEANQFAKIQLHANSFQSRPFEEDVKVSYTNLPGIMQLKDFAPSMIAELKPWIQDKIDKGEQIAFLAYRRKDLEYFENTMKILFPNCSLINIVPARIYEQTFFSKYVRFLGKDLAHKPGNDITTEVMRHMINNMEQIGVFNDNAKNALKTSITEWVSKNQETLKLKELVLRQGLINMDEFIEYVFQTLIDCEIERNAIKLRLTSMANEKLKERDISSFNFITSTIHSAKGLEFDNVILFYNENQSNEEEMKRMYYVGLTRAKSAEYVLAYNANRVNSRIMDAYKLMCQNKNGIIAEDNGALSSITIDEEKGNSTEERMDIAS